MKKKKKVYKRDQEISDICDNNTSEKLTNVRPMANPITSCLHKKGIHVLRLHTISKRDKSLW